MTRRLRPLRQEVEAALEAPLDVRLNARGPSWDGVSSCTTGRHGLAPKPDPPTTMLSAHRKQEIVADDHVLSPIPDDEVDVINYWLKPAMPGDGKDGMVVDPPKYPLLSMLARIYVSVNRALCSYQRGRDFSALAMTLGKHLSGEK